MPFETIMASITAEYGKLFYKNLLKQRQAVARKERPVQVEVVEPFQVILAGKALPPLNPSSKKVRREKEHKKFSRR